MIANERPLAVLLCLLPLALPAAAAAPAADRDVSLRGAVTASTDVTVVEVPVYVSGKGARPVRGLKKDDFELYDGGKRVTGWDLEVIDLEDFARQTVTPDIPLPPAAQRHFFFLFDLTFAQPINVARARHAAAVLHGPGDTRAHHSGSADARQWSQHRRCSEQRGSGQDRAQSR